MKSFNLDESKRNAILLPEKIIPNLFIQEARFISTTSYVSVADGYPKFLNNSNSDNKVLNLLSSNNKLILISNESFYYMLHDFLGEILIHHSENPDIEIIYCVKNINSEISLIKNFNTFLFKLLNQHNINYKIFDMSQYDLMIINNFYLQRNIPNTSATELVYRYVQPYIIDKTIIPFRKVYLSRSHMPYKDFSELPVLNKNMPRVFNDDRIDSHEKIENFFRSMGFEIINAENFNSFEDQINFFNEVKCLASLTSSGITNEIFMQPGQNIIEIVTPLIHAFDYKVEEHIHFYYNLISFIKNHTHLSIPNITRSFENLENFIFNNKKLLSFIKDL